MPPSNLQYFNLIEIRTSNFNPQVSIFWNRQFRHRSTQLLFDEIGEEQTLVFDDKRGRVEWIHTGICNTPYNDTRIVNGNDFQSNNLQCDNPMLHVSKSKRRRGRWQLKHGCFGLFLFIVSFFDPGSGGSNRPPTHPSAD